MSTNRRNVFWLSILVSAILLLLGSGRMEAQAEAGGQSPQPAARRKTATPTPMPPPTSTSTPMPIPTNTPTPTPTPTGPVCAWRVVSSPNATTTSSNFLEAIAAISANDIWAVGEAAGNVLVEHWNGSSWSIVPAPYPTGSGQHSALRSVAAVAANDVWAVGYATDPVTGWSNLILHWDGVQWSTIPSPNVPGPGNNALQGVAAISGNNIWAVGGLPRDYGGSGAAILMHWDGTAWSIVPNPPETASWYSSWRDGIVAVTANDIWAIGSDSDAFHWDGTQWSVVSGASSVSGISASAAHDVWAVGSYTYYDGYFYYGPYAFGVHWDGTRWLGTNIQSPTGNEILSGVDALVSDDVWAVGRTGRFTLIEHWNGTSWSIIPSANGNPTPPTNRVDGNVLYAVSALSSQNVWAVGYYYSNSNIYAQTLIEQYSCQ